MTKKVKLFIVDEKPYLASLDEINVGDKVIVTVGGQYPTLVVCENEMTLNLITDSRLKLTQPFKVFQGPESVNLTPDQLEKLSENDGVLEVVEENVNAVTFEIDNSIQLADKITKMVEDASLRERFSIKSKAIFDEKFKIEFVHQKMLDLYKNLVRK